MPQACRAARLLPAASCSFPQLPAPPLSSHIPALPSFPCSRLGSAVGFRLKNLPKLADSKAADGKTTLLQVWGACLGREGGGGGGVHVFFAAEVMKAGDELPPPHVCPLSLSTDPPPHYRWWLPR